MFGLSGSRMRYDLFGSTRIHRTNARLLRTSRGSKVSQYAGARLDTNFVSAGAEENGIHDGSLSYVGHILLYSLVESCCLKLLILITSCMYYCSTALTLLSASIKA